MQHSTQGFRLSQQQKHLWSLQSTDAAHPFRALCAILLEGDLQPRLLEHALYALVQRHEILRTTFQRPTGIKTPFQVVSENVHPGWQAVDLSHLDAAHQSHRLDAAFAEERARPLNFECESLLRVSAFKLSAHRRVMLVSLPSLCADAVTLTNFVRELSDIYEELVREREFSDEACDSMQYADFAEWQNELLTAGDAPAAQGQAYWQQQTGAGLAPPVLPLEKPTTAGALGASFLPARIPVLLNKKLCASLDNLARESEVTLSSLLFASWQAFLWRLTGQSDILVFALSEGRKLDDLKTAFGLYALWLPVRCHCEDFPFSELLRGARGAAEGHDWQEWYDPTSTPAGNVAFEFTEEPDEFPTSSVVFSILKRDVCHQPFKLKLSCQSTANELTAELQFDTRVFERDCIVRFAGYWQRFLTEVAQTSIADSEPDSQPKSQDTTPLTIGAFDILGAAERRQLLSEFNQTQTDFPEMRCIHEQFEQQVVRTPEAIALVYGETQLTYAQVNARANQLAHLLRRRGVAANDRVGLCLPRSAEMIVALLGILKAGGAYVPLNPEHPPERIADQLTESDAAALITGCGATAEKNTFAGEKIDLDLQRELISTQPEENLSTPVRPDDLVYVIYTSGSTGVPKGVAIRHRNLINYTNFILQRLKISGPLNFALASTIAADLGNTCIFPALVSGGCLHILPYDLAMDGTLFKKYVGEHAIDILKIVPSHFQALLAAEPDRALLPSKCLLLGGEALSHELAQKILGLNGDCRLLNHYGPTETTVGSLTFEVDPYKPAARSLTVPIGRPVANTRVYVLDKNLRPQPLGVAGELYIGGDGVADGYLNQSEETAARFIADPFAARIGERFYRTGDLARYLPDGNIEFLGRVDQQIKVRGFRVELGEIEAALLKHPQVRQAVVVPGTAGRQPSVTASPQLVAYIVSTETRATGAEALRNFLRVKLPDYMIPSIFVSLAALPLTANGKIDRAALPAPEDLRPDLEKVFVAPRSDTEKTLASIWSTVLGISEVGVFDNFFDLGGHSLLATQVVSRMRQAFQTEIPLVSIFQSPTVAALSETIDRERAVDTQLLLADLEQMSDDEVARLLRDEGQSE